MTILKPYQTSFLPQAVSPPPTPSSVYTNYFPVRLWGGGEWHLPLRQLSPDLAIALIVTSQLSHHVLTTIVEKLVQRIEFYERETGKRIGTIAGIAKLGYVLGQKASELLGHDSWAPIDSSQKVWYLPDLSAPATSITTAEKGKMMYLDPYLQSRVQERIVALVDDALCTGNSALAAIRVLQAGGAKEIICFPLVTEGHQWKETLRGVGLNPQTQVFTLGHLPMFQPNSDITEGWTPIPNTL